MKIKHGGNMGIKLVVRNGIAYVWNVEDWMKIRKFRVVGNFVGSLAALPRQNQLAGLPLALLKEETTLLLEKGHAVIKIMSNMSHPPSEDIKKESDKYLQKLFSEQTEFMQAKRRREIESKIDIILEGKKAKKKYTEEAKVLSKETVLEEELNKLQPIKASSLSIQICTDDPWLKDEDYQDCPWDYPGDRIENLHYSVFKDLWERGYYVTRGTKFGGDFLAYPGDPVKFHAFFIVMCVEKDKKLTMSEIIMFGRLGNSVRKTVAFAYLDENNAVNYQSIQWSGF